MYRLRQVLLTAAILSCFPSCRETGMLCRRIYAERCLDYPGFHARVSSLSSHPPPSVHALFDYSWFFVLNGLSENSRNMIAMQTQCDYLCREVITSNQRSITKSEQHVVEFDRYLTRSQRKGSGLPRRASLCRT